MWIRWMSCAFRLRRSANSWRRSYDGGSLSRMPPCWPWPESWTVFFCAFGIMSRRQAPTSKQHSRCRPGVFEHISEVALPQGPISWKSGLAAGRRLSREWAVFSDRTHGHASPQGLTESGPDLAREHPERHALARKRPGRVGPSRLRNGPVRLSPTGSPSIDGETSGSQSLASSGSDRGRVRPEPGVLPPGSRRKRCR